MEKYLVIQRYKVDIEEYSDRNRLSMFSNIEQASMVDYCTQFRDPI